VDVVKNQVCVERSDWKGHVTSPKGGRLRYVPLTRRLAAALRGHRHLRGARVLCEADGRPMTQKVLQCLVRRAARRAGLTHDGLARPAPHVLLAPGDAGRAGPGDSGAGRAQGLVHDAAVHAPQSSSHHQRDPAAKWWRRRELNPRPRKRRRSALRACLHSDVATGFERSQDSRPPSPKCLAVTVQGSP